MLSATAPAARPPQATAPMPQHRPGPPGMTPTAPTVAVTSGGKALPSEWAEPKTSPGRPAAKGDDDVLDLADIFPEE